jgi:predicted RNase H-like HicB family nuclease
MLVEYIQAAMQHAEFEQMEDGRFFGTIPPCQGVWADGDTMEETRHTLQEVLEDWIIARYRHDLEIPLVDGLDINLKPVAEEYAETNQTT